MRRTVEHSIRNEAQTLRNLVIGDLRLRRTFIINAFMLKAAVPNPGAPLERDKNIGKTVIMLAQMIISL